MLQQDQATSSTFITQVLGKSAASKQETCKVLAENIMSLKVQPDDAFDKDDWFQNMSYLLCNEDYLHNNIKEKLEQLPDKREDRINIAVILGEGHFPSLTSLLYKKIDLVVFYDVNSNLHIHLQIMIEAIKLSESIEEFLKNYENKMIEKFNEEQAVQISKKLMTTRTDLIGELFFLANEEKFALCKENLEKIEVAYFHASILNSQHIQQLIECFSDSNISCLIELINITNIEEYCSKGEDRQQLQSSLNSLALLNRESSDSKTSVLYSGLYKGTLMESYLTLGQTSKHVAQLTQELSLEKMQILQHESQQFDPFNPSATIKERFTNMQRMDAVFAAMLNVGNFMPPPSNQDDEHRQNQDCTIS